MPYGKMKMGKGKKDDKPKPGRPGFVPTPRVPKPGDDRKTIMPVKPKKRGM